MMVPDVTDEENAVFKEYEELLETVPIDCDAEMVEKVASKLRGGAGPSSVDAIAMKNWLLRHGRALQVLREEMAEWMEWLCNVAPLGGIQSYDGCSAYGVGQGAWDLATRHWRMLAERLREVCPERLRRRRQSCLWQNSAL